MLYSVWNQAAKIYDYYQTPMQSSDTDTPTPDHLKRAFSSPIGVGSDVAWPLPEGAVKVGSGMVAKGSIAKIGGGGALGFLDIAGFPMLPFILGGIVLYFLARK